MFTAIIRTVVLIGIVLVLSRFIPFVASHELLLLIIAVALGLLGFVLRSLVLIAAIVAVSAVVYFLSLWHLLMN